MKPKIGETQSLANSVNSIPYTNPTYGDIQDGYDKGGGTTTPTQRTILECKPIGLNSITLNWDRQNNLTNFDHYEVQVSSDESNWYSLRNDGVDWKDQLGAVTSVYDEYITHENIPPGGTEDDPTPLTLYYHVRTVTKEPVNGEWSATASATANLIESKYIKKDAVTSAKLINDAVTSAKIAAQAVLEEALAAGAVTETKIGEDSISTAKLQAAAVTAAKIAAGAIVTEKLSVIAREYINNISQTHVLNGWGGIHEDGSGSTSIMSLVDATVNGAVTKVLRMTNTGNRHIRSKTFPINHDKIYRFTVWLNKSSDDGNIELGLSAFNETNEGNEGTNNGQGTRIIQRYNAATRAYVDEQLSVYFTTPFDQTTWTEYTSYIVGANRDVNDCPQHKNCTYIAKLKSDTTDVAIRFLNWANTSEQTLDLCSPSITEVGAGQIVAENIVAGSVVAAKIAAGAVETSKLAAYAVIADKIAANAITAGKISANTLQTLLLKAIYLWIGYAGTGDYDNPDEGDRRIYADGDEILFQIYTKGAWSTERQIVLGGVDSNSNFRPFLACRGVLGDITDSPLLDPIPTRDHHLFKFDNNAEDQHGVDPWTVTSGAFTYSSDTKWEGTHSLASSGTFFSAWYDGGWNIGDSVTGCFMFRDNGGTAIIDILSWGGVVYQNYILLRYTIDEKIQIQFKKNGTVTSQTFGDSLALNTWHFICFTYNRETNTAYLRVNNNEYSFSPDGSWGSGSDYVYLSMANGGNGRFLDDLLISNDTAMDPDLFFQHVKRNVAWTAEYFAHDILLKPKPGGRVVIDDGDTEPSGGTWHKIANPPTNWIASKTSGWTVDSFSGGLEVDFSNVVPAGTKAVRVIVAQSQTQDYIYWRKSGDSNISNTPYDSREVSHLVMFGDDDVAQAVIWLSGSYKAQFAVINTSAALYVAKPVEYLL